MCFEYEFWIIFDELWIFDEGNWMGGFGPVFASFERI